MYNKLFTKILDSSIWLEDVSTRIAWLTFIAAMDENGFVSFASTANMARRANISEEEAEKAVQVLESPDKNSSDPDFEGRRIERIEGGWMVLNAEKYRDLVTRENIKEKTRARVAEFRRKKKCNAPVTECNDLVTPSDTDKDQTQIKSKEDSASGGASGDYEVAMKSLNPKVKVNGNSRDPRVLEFQVAWGKSYFEMLMVPYANQGAKDVAGIKNLLDSGITVKEAIPVAKLAWAKKDLFNCKQALSIASFCSRFNEIRGEVGVLKSPSSNVRNSFQIPS